MLQVVDGRGIRRGSIDYDVRLHFTAPRYFVLNSPRPLREMRTVYIIEDSH